jgi:GxxExxY protein
MTLEDITYKINGCAMKVHKTLGNGFQEVIYQRCLAIELKRIGLEFEREREQIIYYEGFEVGTRRADFVVENKVIVELKATINLEDVHLAQAKNYVIAYNYPIGLLINFGATSLQFKKVYNPKYNQMSEAVFAGLKDKQDFLHHTNQKQTSTNNLTQKNNPVNPKIL